MSYGGGYGYGGPPPGGQYDYGGPPPGQYGGPPQGQFRGYGGPPQRYEQPNFQQAPGGSFQPSGNKRALICGCNYEGSDCQLGGCINDAKCMAFLLTNRFGFRQENMRILLDDNPDWRMRPTRQNMLEGFQWLVQGCQPGDSLFFHYSGHGSQVADTTGDQPDGMNETLCPTDFRQAGMILDIEVNQMLINRIPQGVRIHLVMDSCHSGSVADLEYISYVKGGHPNWSQEYRRRPSVHKGTAGGRAFQFSAATDDQTAADTNKLSGNVSTGAATFSFIQAIEKTGTNISYGTLLHDMHRSLKGMNGGGGGGGGLSSLLEGRGGGLAAGLLSMGMEVLSSRGGGGGGDLGSILGSLVQNSNSSSWHRQTPCLSSNEPFDFNMPLQL